MSFRYKRKRRRNDHRVDDWLMTYADMITLLLCFFAIFLSVSVPRKEQMEKAREVVMEQFSTPDALAGKELPPVPTTGSPDLVINYENLPSIVDRFPMNKDQTKEFDQTKTKDTTNEATLNLTAPQPQPDSDRIKTIEVPSAAFFESGSSDLSEEGKFLLQKILTDNLTVPDVQDYQITVEGHTDDAPIQTLKFPSNWELSTARAAAVVRFLIEHGIPAQRLRAAGYGDVFPKVPNRDEAGIPIPENRAQNRRVIIKLEKIEKSNPPAPQ